MIKYEFENNWANNVLDLRVKYSLPLHDENIRLLLRVTFQRSMEIYG